MAGLILEVSEETFENDVLASKLPVLLDLWAPWCGPCKAVAPVLNNLAPEYEGALVIAKLDVEKYPAVQKRLGVRGIPTLILFREGKEVSRVVGVKRADKFRRWLAEEGITAPEGANAVRVDQGAGAGAFHGDAELREWLLARLCRRAAAGCVDAANSSTWYDGKGSMTTAMVSHASAEVFTQVTGMPASFGAALEFCTPGAVDEQSVLRLLEDVRPGADLRQVGARLALHMLGDSMADWPALLGAELDTVRTTWISLVNRKLAGESVGKAEWQALASALEAVSAKPRAPERAAQTEILVSLRALTPLPASDDTGAWGGGLTYGGRFLKKVLAGSLLGWTTEFGIEAFRDGWFQALEAKQPGGKFTQESLGDARNAWIAEHGDKQAVMDAFYRDYQANLAPVYENAIAELKRLIQAAPVVVAQA
ncbi:MAG: thioredoxin [Candidatus Dactylopiibacterium carminicum]|nr:MAG: thioredoxin [Candidatus Dactylopiibacterium carminicum]